MSTDLMRTKHYVEILIKVLRRFVYAPGNGERPDAPDVAVVISDGPATLMAHRTADEANRTKHYGIEVGNKLY